MGDLSALMFYVNGRKVVEKNADPETTLLTYLRNTLRLTGSKLGCGEGGCGACTVMVSKWDKKVKAVRHFAVNACLASVVYVHECAVTTIEGIGSTKTKLHQVQERLARFHGSQCGFCTPGIIMSMYALLRNRSIPSSSDIDACLQGNLCRCTGYRPILAAFKTFSCGMGDKCCKNFETKTDGIVSRIHANGVSLVEEYAKYDPSQETIFPPELMILGKSNGEQPRSMTFIGERTTWHRPTNLDDMIRLKFQYPGARIVVGNTEVGIEMNIKGMHYPHIICPSLVAEMNEMITDENGVRFGSACTLTDVEEFFKEVRHQKKNHETQILDAVINMLTLFAGCQIRNVACIGGNIMTASPISDLNPILAACNIRLTFTSVSSGAREVIMDDAFFTGYRKTSAKPDEILVSLRIPFTTENEVMRAYKQSKRKDDDIAIVNGAMKVSFRPGTDKVEEFSAAYGGMAAVTKIPKATMKKMHGRTWNSSLLEDACRWLSDELELSLDAPGGMVEYRRTLVCTFFFKFYHEVLNILTEKGLVEENGIRISRDIIGEIAAENKEVIGTQTWQEVPDEQSIHDTVGRPIQHLSALKQVTGEAKYVDDMPRFKDELYMALVYSSRAHAKIVSVDTSQALASKGVVSYVDKNDVPGSNEISGQQVFADGKVTCVGHVIGAVIADTQAHAIIAARLVRVEYENLEPQIITIEDAIKHKSYYGNMMKMRKGSVEAGFKTCDHILKGEFRTGGQEHFYLETQACIAIPLNEDGEMEIVSSSQHPTQLQSTTAHCLGVAVNKVKVRVKRMGGGFGGKESKSVVVSSPAAVAARKLGKPIRCMLTRQDDMQITGGRHPFLARYKVGFNKDGRIMALHQEMYSNAGNTIDLSLAVIEKAMTQCDNCYNVPNLEIRGYACRTNITSNTAFRGFGAPQAMLIAEDWITRVAASLTKAPEEIREKNMYKEGDTTHFGLTLRDFRVKRCWHECLEKSDFYHTRKKFDEFNGRNRWKKRGIACIPTKFCVGFGEARHLNQAGCLVLIYTDGSVLLSHGGTEMGQGLHTKMTQVASRVLGVPLSFVHISDTTTNTVPNTSATAASLSSDLNGMAIKDACDKLMRRLEPIRKANPGIKWVELVHKAYTERISLSATGFFKVPDLNHTWDNDTGIVEGNMFIYIAYGAAVSQVEIDVLTGHHVVLKTDLVMDVGNSLNPAIDIGQIEGAFAQGYGMVTLEEPLISKTGKLWTTGPGAYKIPGFADTPKKFNVHLLRSCPNEKAIYSSKAVGEPPLFLASSVFFAIKEAIASAREDASLHGPFRLDSPATSERIRMACQDQFTARAKVIPWSDAAQQPWSIRP